MQETMVCFTPHPPGDILLPNPLGIFYTPPKKMGLRDYYNELVPQL